MKWRILLLTVYLSLGAGSIPASKYVYQWWNTPLEASPLGELLLDSIEQEKGWQLSPSNQGIYHKTGGVEILTANYIQSIRTGTGDDINAYTYSDRILAVRAAKKLHTKLMQNRFK